MEYIGQAHTATYMTGPRLGGSAEQTLLPSITVVEPACKPYDTYPAPTPLRRSLTTLPWRPSAFYGSARLEPTIPNTISMPEPLSERNRLTDLDSIKVPPVFSAARNALYSRYTDNDWMASNHSNYLSAYRVKRASEQQRSDTVCLCRETDDKTRRTQTDVGKKIGQRLGDLGFWKTEVQDEMDRMVPEIEALARAKACMEKALAESENVIHISQENLYFREKRQSIDLVHDSVENMLIQEVDNTKRLQHEMRKQIQDATNQIALNRAALHELERDCGDKFLAFNIDSVCHYFRNSSRGLHFHDGIERVDNTNSVTDSWARFSNNNILRSKSERMASKKMRDAIEDLLIKASKLMVHYWNTANNAFADQIAEHVEAKRQLSTHLSKILQECMDQEKNIDLIKKSLEDKEAPMKVAQTRLEARVRRPNMEACRDMVQYRLVEEVYEINETVDQLRAKLREAENTLQHLLRTKCSLEHDLSIKNNSLFIDREKCMGMRKTFPICPRVACY